MFICTTSPFWMGSGAQLSLWVKHQTSKTKPLSRTGLEQGVCRRAKGINQNQASALKYCFLLVCEFYPQLLRKLQPIWKQLGAIFRLCPRGQCVQHPAAPWAQGCRLPRRIQGRHVSLGTGLQRLRLLRGSRSPV